MTEGIDPDPWMRAMLRGDFAGAWRVSDRVLAERLASGRSAIDTPRHRQLIWNGEDLAGRDVLVRCYHGLGDTIQFVRLLPLLRARAARVTLWSQPILRPLLQRVRGIDRLADLQDGTPTEPFDTDIELMELGHALRLDITQLPGPIPYIYVWDTHRPPATGDRPRVGLCWRSGTWNPERSIPEAVLEPLGRIPGIEWCTLQFPPRPLPFPARDLTCGDDLLEYARRVGVLDLVITVDSFMAHLAGALGVRVWTLLPYRADWRWMEGRDDTPWYPTMRLFRQPAPGDWAAVIDAVVTSLARDIR